ncbi:zinc-ribbon domain-containing protein [Ureibacillus chungkukjangi]|uniref:zinc-ribbon domain-containing protein n=1 Tax=Ureibacillus chungkukjangi TaxID=1202712 RepID=UPI00203F2209|nr:zinc-ribbon domain-containing protein [Ureibacillus chungkukjangi]MCM3387338.1 zinc-ribbon domain-containing protein [Ureibacillus chungkukjangi]
MSRKKTNEEFLEELKIKNTHNIKPLDKYEGLTKKILVKCEDCNHEWYVKPNNLLSSNSGCPECCGNSATNSMAKENLIKHLDEIGEGFLELVYFKNFKTNTKVKCINCNSINKFEAGNLLRTNKYPCKYCDFKGNNVTKYNFKEKVKNIHGDSLIPIEEYKNSRDKIKLICKVHGAVEMLSSNVLRAKGCIECSVEERRIGLDNFINRIYELYQDEYTIIGNNYVNVETGIRTRHNICNHEWDCRPHDLLSGNGICPKCRKSKSEKKILALLHDNTVKVSIEKTFENCRKKLKLPFDFYLDDYLLVEYDGEQHFKPYFKGKETKKKLLETQENDKIKNQYCIDNNIPLIRIPYWEQKNIEYILDNVLYHFNIKKLDDENTYDQEIVKRYLVDSNWNHDTYISWQDKDRRYWLFNK